MSTAVESAGFILCMLGWLVNGATLANDYWKVSSMSGTVITAVQLFENLWHSCAEDSTGMAECRDFDSMLDLPTHVQACRALMIIALLLGLIAMILSLLGLKCIKVGSATNEAKGKVAGIGGILSVLAGMCCMIAVSWYANRVVEEFNNPLFGGIRFELGAGLYMGWGGSFLAILGGALLITAFRRASPAKGGLYGNQPQKKVYIATSTTDPGTGRAYV